LSITVELTYDMSKALGARSLEVEGAATVADVLRLTRARFGERAAEFERLTGCRPRRQRRARDPPEGLRTPVADGDRVTFVKAAAGG